MAVTRNMNPKKCPMPSQEPDVRNKNFDEVALGYTYDMAVNEAKRCPTARRSPAAAPARFRLTSPRSSSASPTRIWRALIGC